MANPAQISEQEILQRMHERVEQGRVMSRNGAQSLPGTEAITPPLHEGLADQYNFRDLHRRVEVVHVLSGAVSTINPRGPGLINATVQLLKKCMRRMLTWYTRPLHQFHAAVTNAFQEQLYALEVVNHQLRSRLDQVAEQSRSALDLQASTQHSHIVRLDAELDGLRELHIEERLRGQEAKLRRLQESHAAGTSISSSAATKPIERTSELPALDFDYFAFEERFRGSEAVIQQRQKAYLEFFRGAAGILDLGCGRGEFLELLRHAGISAKGVESSHDAYLLCEEKGLNVVEQNLFDFLESTPDGTVGGIFAAQVIEHLPVQLQLHLVHLGFRKLKPGGRFVLETVNPECAFALARNFYLDPTHVRPVHPELLKFALESKGFEQVRLIFSGPVEGKYVAPGDIPDNSARDLLAHMNEFLFGHQDYAIVGVRPE